VTALPEARVDVDDFVTLFGDGWIEQSFSRSRDKLGDLFTVWYAGEDGAHARTSATPARDRYACAR
jgi:hypothetical protein